MSQAARQIGSYTEWLNGFQSAVGFGRMNAATDARERRRASQLRCCELDVLLRNHAAPNSVPSPRSRGRTTSRCTHGTARREADVFVRLDPRSWVG